MKPQGVIGNSQVVIKDTQVIILCKQAALQQSQVKINSLRKGDAYQHTVKPISRRVYLRLYSVIIEFTVGDIEYLDYPYKKSGQIILVDLNHHLDLHSCINLALL